MYIYIYIHTHTYAYIHTYIHTYIYTCGSYATWIVGNKCECKHLFAYVIRFFCGAWNAFTTGLRWHDLTQQDCQMLNVKAPWHGHMRARRSQRNQGLKRDVWQRAAACGSVSLLLRPSPWCTLAPWGSDPVFEKTFFGHAPCMCALFVHHCPRLLWRSWCLHCLRIGIRQWQASPPLAFHNSLSAYSMWLVPSTNFIFEKDKPAWVQSQGHVCTRVFMYEYTYYAYNCIHSAPSAVCSHSHVLQFAYTDVSHPETHDRQHRDGDSAYFPAAYSELSPAIFQPDSEWISWRHFSRHIALMKKLLLGPSLNKANRQSTYFLPCDFDAVPQSMTVPVTVAQRVNVTVMPSSCGQFILMIKIRYGPAAR
jgi:hypothetical protein